jgi:hypothetical protein
MKLKINESERNRILNLHRPSFLLEQANVVIRDLQTLIGVSADNNLGNQTANKLLQILKNIPGNGCSAGGTGSGTNTVPKTSGSNQIPPIKNPLEF